MTRWWMLVPAIGFLLAVSAVSAPAATDCFSYCLEAPGAGGSSNCASRCSPGGDLDMTHPWKRTISYGAIAYGAKSTANGYSFDQDSEGAAKRKALNFCREHGDDCEVVASFINSCAAVAAVEEKGVYSVGTGGTGDSAQSKAMAACTQKHGKGCEIEAWSCAKP